jgi:hypothetical protein
MFGRPEDVVGQCNAHLYIGDDYGDNEATMRCQREPNHEGRHREEWMDGKAVVEWETDERERETV